VACAVSVNLITKQPVRYQLSRPLEHNTFHQTPAKPVSYKYQCSICTEPQLQLAA